jgi:hypothetical protein
MLELQDSADKETRVNTMLSNGGATASTAIDLNAKPVSHDKLALRSKDHLKGQFTN